MIKYYIRTTGERKLDKSYSQIPYVKLVDKNHEYIDFFVDQLERVGVDDCVIIEDDCVLCRDFKSRIEAVISLYPNKVINFFYWAEKYFLTRESDDFVQNQCTYYPKGFSQILAREMRKAHKEFPTLCTDRVESVALKRLKVKHIQYRPCLVQHLNFDSLLNHPINWDLVRTPYFIDYLDKFGFDYDHLNHNQIVKLKLEMKKDIFIRHKKWEESLKKESEIKYFIRTTNERILNDSYDQIKFEKLVDLEHKPVKSFIEQLEYISDYDAVFLEDDCELCEDFKVRIESIIEKYPDRIINFFTRPNAYFETHEEQVFYYNQCTYYPKGLGKKIADEMKKIEEIHPNKYQYDVLESMALKNLGIKHIQYRPCLVQHLDFKSLVGNRDGYRYTPYYIEYLKKLYLTYEEAKDQKNRIKLKYEMLRHINKIKATNN